MRPRHLGGRADGGDRAVLDDDGTVFDDFEAVAVYPDELPGAVDDGPLGHGLDSVRSPVG